MNYYEKIFFNFRSISSNFPIMIFLSAVLIDMLNSLLQNASLAPYITYFIDLFDEFILLKSVKVKNFVIYRDKTFHFIPMLDEKVTHHAANLIRSKFYVIYKIYKMIY